jgi:hypothetical protein
VLGRGQVEEGAARHRVARLTPRTENGVSIWDRIGADHPSDQ